MNETIWMNEAVWWAIAFDVLGLPVVFFLIFGCRSASVNRFVDRHPVASILAFIVPLVVLVSGICRWLFVHLCWC